ncbi:hypothetical protein Tco_1506362 [Tanacetum coccineum]
MPTQGSKSKVKPKLPNTKDQANKQAWLNMKIHTGYSKPAILITKLFIFHSPENAYSENSTRIWGVVERSRYVVPTGRVKVPAGRYVVPTGKDNVIVSAGRSKVIPAGRTILVLVVLCLLRVDSIVS